MTQNHNDQRERHAEFLRLFGLLPGESKAAKIRYLRRSLGDAAPAHITLRQWLMAEPPRYPSRAQIALLRSVAHQAYTLAA